MAVGISRGCGRALAWSHDWEATAVHMMPGRAGAGG